ncbi:MAG TPA: alpha/beta hydrolase [Hyphomicrobiales bacterium]|nr:alpha/beta hydrolase [Kaistiaceae bacterium]HQF30672.1 alpha/beta hydrolase [Hyphomicrobiales bacterium]
MIPTEPVTFIGVDDNRLVGEMRGEGGRPVLLLHGGGQTRHSWEETAIRLARAGYRAITIDQRGHGDSDWVASGAYIFTDYAADVVAVARDIERRFGARPVAIGASLGGISSLLAEGDASGGLLEALVLVDITPKVDAGGVARILAFMGDKVEEGFASIEEAADAIASYLPHRKRPQSLDGLQKNLRLDPDGRYRWHWDPAFLVGRQNVNSHVGHVEERLHGAAKSLTIPVLLVRGARSELVSEDHARAFLDLVPHARMVDVSGAGHMVAGDRNDIFGEAIIGFLEEAGAA